jgi:hypothetical protein
MQELRPWGPGRSRADSKYLEDNYLQIFAPPNAVTSQNIPLAGWQIVNAAGDVMTLPPKDLALFPVQTYLITGPDYSLGAVSPGDVAATSLVTKGAANPLGADANGVFSFQLYAPDAFNNSAANQLDGFRGTNTDTVSTENSPVGLANPGSHPLLELAPPPTNSQPAQWAWTRLYNQGIPRSTGVNLSDFILVSNSAADVGVPNTTDPPGFLQPALGAPAPSSSGSEFQQDGNFHSALLVLPPAGSQKTPPNRIYKAGSPGQLVVKRTITNNLNFPACAMQIRVTSLSQLNGGPDPFRGSDQPPNPAELRIVGPGFVGNGSSTAPNTPATPNPFDYNPTANTVYNLTPMTPSNSDAIGGGSGQNATFKVRILSIFGPNGMPAAATVSVSFTFAVDRTGFFWFGYNVLSYAPNKTGGPCP